MRAPAHDRTRDQERPSVLDANAVVSYNVRAIRERRGWTQEKVAELLGELTGHKLPQASISAMERGFDGERRRRFDAHELYLLALVFDVPIVYFFTPPPQAAAPGQVLADTGQPVWDLYAAILGRYAQLQVLDERLALVDVGGRECTERALAALFGTAAGAPSWAAHYRSWRDHRLHQLAGRWGEDLVEAAGLLAAFVRDVRALRPEAFVAELGGTEVDADAADVAGGGSSVTVPPDPDAFLSGWTADQPGGRTSR
jgi:transcriptional regulator with XRE-family HTH domain